VWIALCVYLGVAILKNQLRLPLSLPTMLQILSVNVFEQVPLAQLFAKAPSEMKEIGVCN
jgi:hypothetical protein